MRKKESKKGKNRTKIKEGEGVETKKGYICYSLLKARGLLATYPLAGGKR